MSIPDHRIERVLREVEGDRVVLETRLSSGERATTRVLLAPVDAHLDRLVRTVILTGRGSSVGLPASVTEIIEAYRVRLRLTESEGLPNVLAAGVVTDPPPEIRARPPQGCGWVYVTTRWIEGRALDAVWAGADERLQRRLAGNVALRLAMLHRERVCYGDLKPSNVVIDGEHVSFIDLDTLREVPERDLGVRTTAATQEYAAPEQTSRRETFLASDIWAFGETVARLVTGQPASPGRLASAGPLWANVIARCQQHTPGSRPTADELAAYLLHNHPLADHEVTARVAEPETTRPPVAGGDITRPIPSGGPTPPPFVPPRVDALPHMPPHEQGPAAAFSAQEPAVAFPEPPAPSAAPEPNTLRFALAGGALVLGLAGLFTGLSLFNTFRAEQAACARVEALRGDLRTQKTVAAQNKPEVLDDIITRLDADRAVCASAEADALYALTRVWGAGWHFSKAAYKKETVEKVRPFVNAIRNSTLPEAQAAVVGFDGALCRLLPDGESERVTACDRAHNAAATALATLPREGWGWLRVEIAWADSMTALGESQRFLTAKQVDASLKTAKTSLPGCYEALSDLPTAPVNGPEMLETCMRIAGYARDLTGHALLAAEALKMATQTGGGIDTKRLGHIYDTIAPECASANAGKDKLPSIKGRGDGGWPDWCAVAGARAVGCGAKVAPPTRVETCTCTNAYGGSGSIDAVDGKCPGVSPFWQCSEDAGVPITKPGVPWDKLIVGGASCPF